MEIIKLENGVRQSELGEMKRRISSRRYVQCCVVQYFHPRAMKWVFSLFSNMREKNNIAYDDDFLPMHTLLSTTWSQSMGSIKEQIFYLTQFNFSFLFSHLDGLFGAAALFCVYFVYQSTAVSREVGRECYEVNNESNKLSQIRFQRNFFLFSKIRSANFACLFRCWLRIFVDDNNLFVFNDFTTKYFYSNLELFVSFYFAS